MEAPSHEGQAGRVVASIVRPCSGTDLKDLEWGRLQRCGPLPHHEGIPMDKVMLEVVDIPDHLFYAAAGFKDGEWHELEEESRRRVSNPQPSAYEAVARPIVLRRR